MARTLQKAGGGSKRTWNAGSNVSNAPPPPCAQPAHTHALWLHTTHPLLNSHKKSY